MGRMSAGVGIDLVEIADVRESIRVFGDRYLNHVYTAAELEECGGSARCLAERFAGKEAVMKALSYPGRLPWQSIAVSHVGPGRPALKLTGVAADTAEAAGITSISISFTNGGTYAAAIVLTEAN
jgi:holo-[acyl-carrier protein] synthase